MSERRASAERGSKGDRRESPRVPMRFLVRDLAESDAYLEREGDLSLGGIRWDGKYPASGTRVEVRFRIPGVAREIRALGEIIRVAEKGEGLDFHLRFTDLAVQAELEIARYLDSLE